MPVGVTPLSPQGIADLHAAAVAVTPAGDSIANSGREFAAVFNDSGGPVTVTVLFNANAKIAGVAPPNITLVINAGKVGIIGPFAPSYFSTNGLFTLNYSASANILIFVGQLSQVT